MSNLDDIPAELTKLDNYLSRRESTFNLKTGTEAKIIWVSNNKYEPTDYALVYLHGFRASHPEGDPVHKTVASTFGWNLYLSRLEEHGIHAKYPLLELTEDKLLSSAERALKIGNRIGKKVILMGTSTGGSLALWLASQEEYKDQIAALILYSPLIRFYGLKQHLLMNALGRKALRFVPGPKHLIKTEGTTYAEERVWYKQYTLQGALALGAFVEHTMQKKVFKQVKCPVFTGYYYKNKYKQDQVVSVSAIKEMLKKLGTRTNQLVAESFPEAKTHVICSSLLSKSVPQVVKSTKTFLKGLVSHETTENV